jgi:alpha-galactosidase
VGNAWRSTTDISRSWQSIRQNFWESFKHAVPRSGKGAFADPDMLEVGVANLTLQEQQSHFALWVMVKAPLLLAMDLDTIPDETLDIIRNKELIRVHQDQSASPAQCFVGCDPQELSWSVFATRDSSGDTVALIINWGDDPMDSISFSGQDVGVVPSAEECVTVTDLWTAALIGTFDFDGLKMITTDYLVSHECAVYRFTTVPCSETEVASS